MELYLSYEAIKQRDAQIKITGTEGEGLSLVCLYCSIISSQTPLERK